jgi:type 1 fimbriae regulatory protein FimB/type 1 fimbriae regulatory protein FimE
VGTAKRVTPTRPKNIDVRPREYLTPDEVTRLANAAKKRGRHGRRDAFMIRFCARHGFRSSELCKLRWDQIKFDTFTMHVNRLKNGRPSVHALEGWEVRELRELKRLSGGCPYVFVNERRLPFERSGFARIVEKAGRWAKLPFPTHAHMLRHACGYNFANEGKTTRELMLYLGHTNIQQTVRYSELSPAIFKDW